ncbi:hypothetical protein ACFYZ8_34130 [Streptomyces sp. NPDC001668]|uniref:hypothetical protein n=1 Tax=Streptomyces sp. NPDC001668 TaxID=3364598 RepID=UPI0036BC4003
MTAEIVGGTGVQPAAVADELHDRVPGEEPAGATTAGRPRIIGVRSQQHRWAASIAQPSSAGLTSGAEGSPAVELHGARHTSRSRRPLNGPWYAAGRPVAASAAPRFDVAPAPGTALGHPCSEPPRLAA